MRARSRVLIVAILAFAAPTVPAARLAAQAAASAPAAPVEHAGTAALVQQIGATPPMSDREFVRRHMAPAGFAWVPETTLVSQLERMRRQSGGLRVTGVEPRGASHWLRVEPMRRDGGAWLEVYRNGAQLMPWTVRHDHFARSGPPPRLPEREVPRDSVLPIVHAWIDWWAQHDRWSGTVGIARRDSTVLLRPVGLADRARGVPNTVDTRYHLGSSNKMLTAIAVLQLVQEGRLRLTDTITKYLPDYPRADVARRITVSMLLSHTAGLGGLFELPRFEPKRRYGSNAAYLPVLADRALLFEPGTRYSYSNEGFLLAGAIIERVTRQSYDSVVATRILRPAQMHGWCDCMATPDAPARAFGYSYREDHDPLGLGPLTDNEYFIFGEGIAAGGYYATATNYLRLAAAMRRGVLLDSAHQSLLFTRSPQSPSPRGYGLGVELVSYGGKASWGHGGGGGRSGVGTQFATFADGSWTVALMGNRDLYLATEMLRPLMTFLARQGR